MSSNNEGIKKTLTVTVLLCLVCSIIVAGAAVLLKPVQQKNQMADLQRNILSIAGVLKADEPVAEQFKQFTPMLVDLRTGKFSEAIDPTKYNERAAAKDPSLSQTIPAEKDIAGIKRRPDYATVYLVKSGDKIDTIVLPVYGQGLWSTMYGYLALKGDLRTVVGFGFYDQGETPGLGGEVDNPKWKALWPGKEVYNNQGQVAIDVVKGNANPKSPDFKYEVDGLAGATLTQNGVEHLLHYWLGESGFGPFLKNLQAGDA